MKTRRVRKPATVLSIGKKKRLIDDVAYVPCSGTILLAFVRQYFVPPMCKNNNIVNNIPNKTITIIENLLT